MVQGMLENDGKRPNSTPNRDRIVPGLPIAHIGAPDH